LKIEDARFAIRINILHYTEISHSKL